jgi:hypothetical protein
LQEATTLPPRDTSVRTTVLLGAWVDTEGAGLEPGRSEPVGAGSLGLFDFRSDGRWVAELWGTGVLVARRELTSPALRAEIDAGAIAAPTI